MRRRLARLFGCALLSAASSAWASPAVLVRASTRELEPAIDRLCAELASAGYAVTFELSETPPPCPPAQEGRGVADVAGISLASKPGDRDAVLATICFDGAVVVVGSPRSEPVRFAVAAAEALNGLRATAPRSRVGRATPQPASEQRPPPSAAPPDGPRTLTFSETLIVDPGRFPPLWGSSLEIELALTRHATFAVGGFVPFSRAELSGAYGELNAGLAFLRAGPRLRFPVGSFVFSGSLMFGPALTWFTASGVAPYSSGSDSTWGAVGAAGGGALYPSRGPVFAAAQGRASLLLPSPRFLLPKAPSRDWGPLLIEMSLGVGLRF